MSDKTYDYLVVGAGFFGSICAHELKKRGKKVCVIDNRNHIGGNCYTEERNGIQVHVYGPHIFHTNNEKVWKWINQFVSFNTFTLRPVAHYQGENYSLPFNMWTFSQLWKIRFPAEAQDIIAQQSAHIKGIPKNLAEQAIQLVGTDVYEKLIKGYTQKQWGKDPSFLPASIIKRLPVRFTYDNNYFNDRFQGIPIGGYTQIFTQLLEGIDIALNTDFFKDALPTAHRIIYTGPIDRFYDYQYGSLEYKTQRFDHQYLAEVENYQGVAMMNYTDLAVPYTRIVEHKHFDWQETPGTWITHEYPVPYAPGKNEPLYPVNDAHNNAIFAQYWQKAAQEENVFFGGRLAEYKYYDMHQIIASALAFMENHDT